MTVSALTEFSKLATTEPKTLLQAQEIFQAIVNLGLPKLREVTSADVAAKITQAAQDCVSGGSRPRTLPQAKAQLASLAALLPTDANGGRLDSTAHRAPSVQSGAKIFAEGAAPKPIKIRGVLVPSPKSDADALRIWQTLAPPIRQDFYALHEKAIWRAYRSRTRPAAANVPPAPALVWHAPDFAEALTSADSATYDRYEALKGAERQAFFSANREALVREHGRRALAAKQTVHAGLVEQYTSLTGQARRDFYAQHQRELFAAYRARNAAR